MIMRADPISSLDITEWKPTADKPVVMCARVVLAETPAGRFAFLDRLSDHPRLGPPRTESQTRTSLILKINRRQKWLETLNTIYKWEDDSLQDF